MTIFYKKRQDNYQPHTMDTRMAFKTFMVTNTESRERNKQHTRKVNKSNGGKHKQQAYQGSYPQNQVSDIILEPVYVEKPSQEALQSHL